MSDSDSNGSPKRKRVLKKLDMQIPVYPDPTPAPEPAAAPAPEPAAAPAPEPAASQPPPAAAPAAARPKAPAARAEIDPADLEKLPADIQFQLVTGQVDAATVSNMIPTKPTAEQKPEPAATPAPEPKPEPAPAPRPAPEPAPAPQKPDPKPEPAAEVPPKAAPVPEPADDEDKTHVDPDSSSPENTLDGDIPSVIADRYEVIRVIGRGGMGVVLLARDTRLQRFVAIKRLSFKSQNMKIVHRRFLREAQTIASLAHQNIVNVFDIVQDAQVGNITVEYVSGPPIEKTEERMDPPLPVNLDQYVKIKGPLEPVPAEKLLVKLCSAMEYAHKHGSLHRDIKPSNVLLTDEMQPKLADFGLARPIEISKTEEITLEGTMLGTPEYSAPEQWGDIKAVGVPADIYALGGVFWFVLSGRIPRFFRESDVAPHISPVIAKALSQKPADRYQTVKEFSDAIRDARKEARAGEAAELNSSSSALDAKGSEEHEGWQCENCTKHSPMTANFCIHCGANGSQTCKFCGEEFNVGAQFCPKCGEDVQLAEESAGALLSSKNHANFLEFETALKTIKPLAKKGNAEAKQLSKEWHEIVLGRRNLLMELESALRVFNVSKAVEMAKELNGLVPEECLSENPDFDVVVKHSELITNLRKMLVESATRSHEEHNLEKFASSITALNQIFGEDVCGAINSQLIDILGALDRMLTEAGLATGMNCHSRALEIINSVPPWKGGELGDRRVRLYSTCKQQVEERERSIDEIEAAIRDKEYSHALSRIRKMAKFRLPPDHSEMNPAKEDLAGHERIIRIDKVLITTIDENTADWIKRNQWEDIRNSLLILKEGESRKWQDLLDRLKRATNKEIVSRYSRAADFERDGRIAKSAKAWEDFTMIPPELAPPHLLQEAQEFPARKKAYMMAKTEAIMRKGMLFLVFLWPYHLWHVGYGAIAPMLLEDGGGVSFSLVIAILQLVVFISLAVTSRLKFLDRMQESETDYPAVPRLMVLATLAAASPLSLVLYQPFNDHLYSEAGYLCQNTSFYVPGIAHPFLITLLVFFVLDLVRGFRWRFPACFGLSLSWLVAGIFVLVAYPDAQGSGRVWMWPVAALLQGAIFIGIQAGDHLYRKNRSENVLDDPDEDEEEQEEPVAEGAGE